MPKRPRVSALLFVYVGLLFCIAFDEVTQLLFNIQGMSALVFIPVAVIGGVVAQHIWKGMKEGTRLGVLGAAGIGIFWTMLPALLAFLLGEYWAGIPTQNALRRVSDFSGAAAIGMAAWLFLVVLKAIAQSVWRAIFVRTPAE